MRINKAYAFQIIFWAFVLFDLGASFEQHRGKLLDGDMVESLVPDSSYFQLFADPFGLEVLRTGSPINNPNRFFGHWLYYYGYQGLIDFFQNFTSPIESLYLAAATCKILFQLSLLLLLAYFVRQYSPKKWPWVYYLALISPLFQVDGFYRQMGLIDLSLTYSFFYALPSIFLLIGLAPIILHLSGKVMSRWHLGLCLLGGIVACFSGPLNAGVIGVSSMVISLYFLRQQGLSKLFSAIKEGNFFSLIPSWFWWVQVPLSIFALYSFYLGTFNKNNGLAQADTWDLYLKLPVKLWGIYSNDWGFGLLLLMGIWAWFSIRQKQPTVHEKIKKTASLVGLFCLAYLVLLPWGGYRDYRPDVLRNDTLSPIILIFIFSFSFLQVVAFQSLSKQKTLYTCVLIIWGLAFTLHDRPRYSLNSCEKENLLLIQNSEELLVKLPNDCRTMSWGPLKTPWQSKGQGKLLKRWKVCDELKRYTSTSAKDFK